MGILLTVILSLLAIMFAFAFHGFLEYFLFDRMKKNVPPPPLQPESIDGPFSTSFLYAQPLDHSSSPH